ncbi:flagellar assembly protein FliW [Paenibacillus marinisediminis]
MSIASEADEVVIHSSVYGVLKPHNHQLFDMTKGMIGFQAIREYALIPYEDTPFYILHAVQEDISFILLPADQVDNFAIELDPATVHSLELSGPEDAVTMLVVNLNEGQVSVNLRAPVILAPLTRKACQYIIHNAELPIRHVLREGGDDSARP